MSESMLNKEFRERDIQRMRNIVTKNFDAATVSQVGYEKKEVSRNEGEIFEENGKRYIIKNGLKQSYTKLDEAKKTLRMPLLCPECSKPMTHTHDKTMYNWHKKCYDCVIVFETQLRAEGKYQEYEQNLIRQNQLSYLKDLENMILMDDDNESFITEDGDVERWDGGNKKVKQMKEQALKELEEIKQRLFT